ncbi:uncharacterized protein [Euphorbia lathyris]|uniref:uncharacterized protein n=1 Tax=Euphorbia lathyris TaxID=212925 RepID=UPI0033132175
MSTERESTNSVPSVMVRLMGLDEIPIQRPVLKKPRVLSENYLRRVSSIGVRKKCSDQQSFKFSNEQQDGYKNVLKVLETLSRKKHHTITVVDAEMHMGSSDLKGRNVMPKDMERKCVSGYGKCRGSEDYHDVHSNLQSGHLAMLKSSSITFRDIRKCSTFRRRSEIKFLGSPKKIQNGVGVYFSGEYCTVDASDFSRSIPNSRIVVVKPTLGKKNDILISPNRNLYVEKKERKRSPNGTQSVRPRFRKERTKTVGQGTSTMSSIEPSSELSGSDYFAKQLELTTPSSTPFSDRKRQINCSGKSYMTGNAKKHISERGNTSKRFKLVELSGRSESRSSSLLECFNSVRSSDSNMRQESLENGGYMSDLESVNSVQNDTREQGLNHIDGLECIRSSSNYKESQVSPYQMPEYNFSIGNYVVQDDQGSKLEKGATGLSSVVTQSSRQNNKTLQEACMKQKGHKNEVEEDDLIDNKFAVPKSPRRSSFSINMEINTETLAVKKSPSNYDKHKSESNYCIFSEKSEDSPSQIQDASHVQEVSNENYEEESVSSQSSCTDPESLITPNSVLDRLGKRDNSSSSDCFKSVSASLHGLHMQLELLKAKTSEAYSVGSSMAVSSDEGSVNESEENQCLMSPLRVEESRDFSYLVDVLTEAGFQSRKQHVPNGPISYSIFETLEKKYREQITWRRSERRLLFDRINLGLGEILEPLKGTVTRTKSVAKRFRYSQGNEILEEGAWGLLVEEEEEVRKESEKMLGKDVRWMELGDEIQEIGREIEDSLIDELIADVY